MKTKPAFMLTFMLTFALILTLASCQPLHSPQDTQNSKTEITTLDISTLNTDSVTGNSFSVMGLSVGDSSAKLKEKLGIPDEMYRFNNSNTTTYIYNKKFLSDYPVLTFSLDNEVIKRINIYDNFLPYMKVEKEQTFFSKDKLWYYNKFGHHPDFILQKHGRIMEYRDKGLAFWTYKNETTMFSLFEPASAS